MADIELKYDTDLSNVEKFKNSGVFENNLDDNGNLQLIISDQQDSSAKTHYVSLELKTFSYDETKILDNNDLNFNELDDEEEVDDRNLEEILNQYNSVVAENRILNDTVNTLVEKYENTDDKVVIESMKKEIINLRIELGQGNVVSDFDDTFPFLPLE